MLGWLRRLLGRGRDEEAIPPRPAAPRAAAPTPDPPPVDEVVDPASPEPLQPPAPRPEAPVARPTAERTIHVHADRLDDRPAPRRLSPSEALRLAREGPAALRRRDADDG